MRFIARSYAETLSATEGVALEALDRVVSEEMIQAAVTQAATPTERRRKLPTDVTLWLCLARGLWAREALPVVMRKMTHGLRLFGPDPERALATKGALSQACQRLGVRPVVALFHQVCQPLATPQTPGAFLGGLRLMAIDGTVEDAPDSPANVCAFGRQHGDRGDSAFPQVQGVYLAECGTHAIVDAGFWPCRVSERVGALRLLRRVGAGMLLLLDRGFYSHEMIERTRATDAHVRARVPSIVLLPPRHLLPDGSAWAFIYPADAARKKRGDHLLVRVIVYTLSDPARSGCGETQRLVTTLLDAQAFPARDLIAASHARWEIELAIDEIDTHQRLAGHPLRSRTPTGVLQELYSLLVAHYAVRTLMTNAAAEAHLAPTRLSFVHALALIRVAIDDFQRVAPDRHARLEQRLLREIATGLLPEHAPRTNPRVVKRKMSKFKLKRGMPLLASQRLVAFETTILLLPQTAPAPSLLTLDAPSSLALHYPCPCLI